jgi:hypothetical protein
MDETPQKIGGRFQIAVIKGSLIRVGFKDKKAR